MFFVGNLIATLGTSSYAVLAAKVQGEGAVTIDLQKHGVVPLVADFFTKRQSRASDRFKVGAFDAVYFVCLQKSIMDFL